MATKRGTEIPTIDVAMVSITAEGQEDEIILDTASQVAVEPQTEETDAIQLIVKGVLKAQKPAHTTLTGTEITLTDNVFIPEVVQILQGGTIYYWNDGDRGSKVTEPTQYGIAGYEPQKVGSTDTGKPFTLALYSAQYDAAGKIVQYEKVTYPHCKGQVVTLESEDDVFRSPEYTITSAAATGEAMYTIDYVDKLPTVAE